MKNKIMKIMFLTWILAIAHIMFAPEASAAYTYTPDSSGLFDKSILEGIQVMMVATYKTLGNVLMIGHALMCYAIDVDYRSVLGLVEIPNLSFLLVGLAIYIVGVFMALSVGMYFVDASLRLGLAIVFMPVSIALWPFPPTSSKFMNNLSTIIRNSMLFVLMSVGIAFAICLIQAGLFEGGSQAFWDAIAEEKTEAISENFSFFSSHILVVGFCLVFGFRILESTVNDYLNSLFSDAMVGSESPMHAMGTQAFGMLAQNAAKPVLSYVGDVATYQTGNLLSAAGDKLTDLSSDEGIQRMNAKYQNIKNVIRNPRQAYNNMMNTFGGKVNDAVQSAGETANRAIQATGRGVQNIVDGVTSALPIPMTEEDRQAMLHGGIENGVRTGNGVNDRIERTFKDWGNRAQAALDPKAQKIGQAAEDVIAHGGGKARKAAVETGKNAVASGIASTRNAVNAMSGNEAPKVTTEEVRAELHEAKETMENAIETAAQEVQEHVIDPVKNTAQKATQAVKNSAVGQAATEFKEGFREGYRGDAGGQPTTPTVASSSQPQTEQNSPSAAQEVTPVVLNNSGEVLDPFQNLENPIGTVRKMAQSNITAPTAATATTRENTAAGSTGATEATTGKMRIIIKKAGEKTGKGAKIVMRQVKKEMQQTKKDAQGALGLMGKGIKGAGDWLKKQPAKKAAERRAQGEESLWAKWDAIGEQARLKEEAKADLAREADSLYEDMKG